MSEVKRISVFIHGPNKKVDMVEAAHLDDAQSELSALREELRIAESEIESSTKAKNIMFDRLTAAEQRNAELFALCAQSRTVINQFMPNVGKCFGIDFALLNETLCDIDRAVNKPTESRASEAARLALSFENQGITPARFKCLACGDYHEGSGNLPCPKMSPMSGARE